VNQEVLEQVAGVWDEEWARLVGGKRLLASMRRRLEKQGIHGPTNYEIAASIKGEDVDPEMANFCATMAYAVRARPRRPARRGR
jgi:hypothetical protein